MTSLAVPEELEEPHGLPDLAELARVAAEGTERIGDDRRDSRLFIDRRLAGLKSTTPDDQRLESAGRRTKWTLFGQHPNLAVR